MEKKWMYECDVVRRDLWGKRGRGRDEGWSLKDVVVVRCSSLSLGFLFSFFGYSLFFLSWFLGFFWLFYIFFFFFSSFSFFDTPEGMNMTNERR